ncbi:hypothetical protein [Neobacillus cucumis]|uniref:hypothetical protein n=1 Tax=Neobacillus cucumis TaxID=1740721 RepID=UPI0035A859A2
MIGSKTLVIHPCQILEKLLIAVFLLGHWGEFRNFEVAVDEQTHFLYDRGVPP